MRVLRVLAGVVLAGGFLLGAAAPGWAQDQPPKLDVRRALDQLVDQQIYRAPGAVAYFDESRVLPVLDERTRVLVAPYSGRYEEGGNYADGDAHHEQVGKPLDDWAKDRRLHLIFVEGIRVTVYGEPGAGVGPTTIPELRQVTAYLDVTADVIFAGRFAAGIDRDEVGDFDYPTTEPVPPTAAQVDDLVTRLENGVYNAPGREDPLDLRLATIAKQAFGLTVRIAAFPAPTPGEPIVDYAPALLKRFPGEIVLVAHGRWLDIAAGDQAKAESARDYAYGRYEYASFTQGSRMRDRISTVLERLEHLLDYTGYGRPQPQPQPRVQPFDVRLTISDLAPWVLVGAALVLGGAGLYTWRRGQALRTDRERRAMRREQARAMTKIGELAARTACRRGTWRHRRPGRRRAARDRPCPLRPGPHRQGHGRGHRRRRRGARGGEMRPSTRKRLSMQLRADHWFGIPRWLVVAFGVAILLAYGTFGRPVDEPPRISEQARVIAEGLRTTSVYEAPDAPGKIDAQRARWLIGNRPIVLVLLGTTPLPQAQDSYSQPHYDLCKQVADVVSTSLVVLYGTSRRRVQARLLPRPGLLQLPQPRRRGELRLPADRQGRGGVAVPGHRGRPVSPG